MSLKKFNKIFRIEESVENEQKKFVYRINSLFNTLEERDDYNAILYSICYGLGINSDEIKKNKIVSGKFIKPLRSVTKDNFQGTLKVLVLLYEFYEKSDLKFIIEKEIECALSYSNVDLGINWKDGMFYPRGAEILDEKLIEDSLRFLADFPNEKKNYEKALSDYGHKIMVE
ncbi:MAG TPA: hypothetical protein DCP53_06935 [Elusimicrobia bacterium]|nr:hypothetical protein [Elusimicrobiota bacterium]